MATVTDYTQGKSELVAWIVSNCGTQLRISFVHELKKYIKVDVFGRCSGNNFGDPRSCSKNRDKTHDCLRQYKFYLAFENRLCEDYITEKYWSHLGKNITLLFRGFINFSLLDLFYFHHTTASTSLSRSLGYLGLFPFENFAYLFVLAPMLHSRYL